METTYPKMLEGGLTAEKNGFESAFLSDHIIPPIWNKVEQKWEDRLESWTLLAGLGVQTSSIRLGHVVLFNSLRHPAYLARSVVTIDHMTKGRYDLYMGAGWNEKEYLAYGLIDQKSTIKTSGSIHYLKLVPQFGQNISP